MTKKYALYPLIMAVVAQLCFLVIVTNTIQPLWGRTMILILPSLIFCTVGLFALSGKLSKDATIILTSVLTIFLFLASVFYVFLLSIWSANTETTDVRDYARAYDDIEDEKGVKNVFPKKSRMMRKILCSVTCRSFCKAAKCLNCPIQPLRKS